MDASRLFVWGTRFLSMIVLLTSIACQQRSNSHQPSLSEMFWDPKASAAEKEAYFRARLGDPVWQKRWWIEKTARVLRGGDGIGPNDDMTELLKLSEDEIAARFMADPRFGDSILDFNLYYLGFKPDVLKSGESYSVEAFDYGNAVVATQEVLKGGDYFKLFDFTGPYFPPPIEVDLADEDATDVFTADELKLSDEELRTKLVADFRKKLDSLLKETKRKPLRVDKLCAFIDKNFADLANDVARFEVTFKNVRSLFIHQVLQPSEFGALDFLHIAEEECVSGSPDVQRLVRTIEEDSWQLVQVYSELTRFEASQYFPKSVAEFKPLDLSAITAKPWLQISAEQAFSLQNSSTNLNRRRAAYVLKRYFCDDLTPVGFESPSTPVGGAHGSDTSCYACHFKLDPMAGFFRNFGYLFSDYSQGSTIEFDDDVEADRNKYHEAWKDPSGKRSWNIGYVRSAKVDSLNSYGESLSDLSKIIREAPEAKRCLVKRMFEYLVAEKQTIDGGYLDHLTTEFTKEAKTNSSMAFKKAMVRLLKSQSFQQGNLDPQQCYDFAPGSKPGSTPPCRVAFVLQKNCVTCHNNANDGRAGLDLGGWVLGPDGKNYNFPHLDLGSQVRPQETLALIAARLTSNDPRRRMPQGTAMADQERQELFLWTQDELARLQKEAGP